MDSIIGFIILGGLVFFGKKVLENYNKSKPKLDGKIFSQKDVKVDFEKGTITCGKVTLPVSSVRSVNTENQDVYMGNSQVAREGRVAIIFRDLNFPKHTVYFGGWNGKLHAETFVARLIQAIEMAGGPTF